MGKIYVVIKGREGPKIYYNWNECSKNVTGYTGAIYKSFTNIVNAKKYLNKYNINLLITNDHHSSVKDSSTISESNHRPRPFIRKKIKISSTIFNKIISGQINQITAYTDGSCRYQGTSRAKAGSGIYIPKLGIEYSSPVPGKQTNNRGELYAVILVLDFIYILIDDDSNDLSNILFNIDIYTDSRYVMNNLRSNNKVNLDLWEKLLFFESKLNVTFHKVLAHSGDYFNEKADTLAKVYAFS